MGNEFTPKDLAPHLVTGLMLVKKLNNTTPTTLELVGGGYHQKMRLRSAFALQVDAAESSGTSVIAINHGANVAATVTLGATDAIGTATELVIADAYKDADADDRITLTSDGAGAAGYTMVFATYELVE